MRPFNTYGPRQSPRAIIPCVISQLLSKTEPLKVGSTFPTRDFLYVSDAVRGYIELAASERSVGQEFNLSTGCETSIDQICHLLIQKINPKATVTTESERVRPLSGEVHRLVGDSQRIKTLTNWQPLVSLEQGLDATIAWFKDNLRNEMYDRYHV